MNKCAEILVIEDNSGDAMLLREAFSGSSVSLSFARDGQEALDLLHRDNGLANPLRPDLIVLDLNMPRMDGLDFLKELRSDPSLRSIQVVVLTGSDAPRDQETARSLGARCFFTKPNKLEGWVSLAERTEALALHCK